MITKHNLDKLGYNFIPEEYLPAGKNEYYLRNLQSSGGPYRDLTSDEITKLKSNSNWAENWGDIKVAEGFNTDLVQGSRFYGLVRIGQLDRYYLTFHDLNVPVGIYDSTVISCDIGTNTSIMKVGYLSHYIIGNETIISQVDEIACTNHSKFGNGTLKEGEPEDVRIWLELGNENGGRKVLPFEGMTSADAYLWFKYRDDALLMKRFEEMTEKLVDPRRGCYGMIGTGAVIKSCRIIKDVFIGDHAYIKGANKLKNLTISSSLQDPTQIGEGVELVNGIIETGCRIFYGVKAVRFYLASHTALKYGARLINSYLGDNSTISCCEVLNSLIFPSHEQHHNNSFLCAALISGQSNMAAGATLGSNHNSRSNDGEITAGRGFWPGLCVSIKHNCRFASFTLLLKADYPAEMNIPLPFSLVSRDESQKRLVILPAYWFLYNMYALARNSWKFRVRDKRRVKKLFLETEYLAPDTVEEMFGAIDFLEQYAGKELLVSSEGDQPFLLPAHLVEKSKQPALLLKARTGYETYKKMIHFYAVKNLINWLESNDTVSNISSSEPGNPLCSLGNMISRFSNTSRNTWINVGGELIPSDLLRSLKDDIKSGLTDSWTALHQDYEEYGKKYPGDKAGHAFASLCSLHSIAPEELSPGRWAGFIEEAIIISRSMAEAVFESRSKDHTDPFRSITYNSAEEMKCVIGKLEDDSFISHTRNESREFEEAARRHIPAEIPDPAADCN